MGNKDVTLLKLTSSVGRKNDNIRRVNSIGSDDHDMVSDQDLISSGVGVIGVPKKSRFLLSDLAAFTHTRHSTLLLFFTSTRHDSKRKRKDTHKGANYTPWISSCLLIFVAPSSIKKISYNAIIRARMVLFWCAPVLLHA